MNGFRMNEREQEDLKVKSQPINVKYANGTEGARVILMVIGGCLPVRSAKGMEWKYDDYLCACWTKVKKINNKLINNQIYTPRIWDLKSQSRVCKLRQTTVDNRRYSDTEYNKIE